MNAIYVTSAHGYVVKVKIPSTKKVVQRQVLVPCEQSLENEALAQEKLALMMPELEELLNADISNWTMERLAKKMLTHKTDLSKNRAKRVLRVCHLFDKHTNRKPFSKLSKQMLLDYLEKHRWSQGNKRMVAGCLKSVAQWHLEAGNVLNNPFAGLKVKHGESRGMECMISDDEFDKLLSVDDATFVDAIRLLSETGARPSELIEARASEYVNGKVIIRDRMFKTKGKDKERKILIPRSVQDIIERRIASGPNGLLFPEYHGRKNPPGKQFYEAWVKWCRRMNISDERLPYGLRHKFAVTMCRRGVPIEVTAALMGHHDSDMIRTCYGHVQDRLDEYRSYLDGMAS